MSSNLELVSVLIPARYDSSRFPGKPLVQIAGKPLIQHVYESVHHIPQVNDVQVVTDDVRIVQAVKNFGGRVSVVDSPCRTGSDRIAKIASQIDSPVVVNLQADEIPLNPALVGDLIDSFLMSSAVLGTLKRPLQSQEDLLNSSIVKVVTTSDGNALYFSRAPIPHVRERRDLSGASLQYFMHLGIYIYRRKTLLDFAELPTGQLEEAEKLEQLRALEHGIPIQVWETPYASLRIDQPEDLDEANKCLAGLARC